MTAEQVRQLHRGDQVYWTDPDEDTCSRMYTIQEIQIDEAEGVAKITDVSGDYLECFFEELS